MEQLINISSEELFGATSRLVEPSGIDALSGIASLGGGYQAATGVVALLFIFILVRYFELYRYLIGSSISKQSNRPDIHIYSAELKNIELFTCLIGVMLLSLLVMRLSVFGESAPLFSAFPALSAWGKGGITLGAILATIVGERFLLYIVGAISERGDVCKMIWHIKQLHLSIAVILLSPLLILVLLTDGMVAKVALCASIAVCSITIILFVKETFLLFRTQRFSIFHWILYLCALELFPLSLLLAPIMRG